jgi:hypothetical protein
MQSGQATLITWLLFGILAVLLYGREATLSAFNSLTTVAAVLGVVGIVIWLVYYVGSWLLRILEAYWGFWEDALAYGTARFTSRFGKAAAWTGVYLIGWAFHLSVLIVLLVALNGYEHLNADPKTRGSFKPFGDFFEMPRGDRSTPTHMTSCRRDGAATRCEQIPIPVSGPKAQ